MTYLLTGATGFIGKALVARLLQAGHNVNYTGRRRSQSLDSRAAFHLWEPDREPPLDSMPDLDAVINLAGEPISQRWTEDVKRRIYESRVGGTRQLVTALSRLAVKPAVLVSASAVGFYGERGDEVLTEKSRPGSGFLAEACVDWEAAALRATELSIRTVLPRIAMVLGRGGGALKQMQTPFRLGLGGSFAGGKQWMPWIHLNDLVELIVFAAENPNATGPWNASAPSPIRNEEFTAAMAHAVHRPAFLPVPKFALALMLGEVAGFVLASQRVVPEAPKASGFRFRHPDIRSALQELTA